MVCKMSGEECAVQSPGSDPDTLDLAGADLEKLSRATPELILNTTTLVLDNNKLQRLDNIHTYQCLEKLSVINNRLIRMFQVGKLHHLKVLDLSNNNIVTIEGLKDVNLLTWLSLANNNIKTIENLQQNVHLEHLDLCGNSITNISDLSFLKNLKTVMLHKNKISSLSKCSSHLPSSLTSLTLADNELSELRDLAHIAHLSRLEQLSLAGNPCIGQPEDTERQWDYRPYVINWCLGLRALDGVPVGAKESLKAEWMYSQSKGRQFGAGEQSKLVEYLIQTCPLDPNQETEQDRKLNLILSKVQEHQSSLRQSRQTESCYATLPRSSSSEMRRSGPEGRRNSGSESVMSVSMSAVTSSDPSSRDSVTPRDTSHAGHASQPGSHHTTPVNTPGLTRRHSAGGRGSRSSSARSRPSSGKSVGVAPGPARYKMELPPTLYGEDLVNGNTELMTQSMDPSVLTAGLVDNGITGHREPETSLSSVSLMSQSADCSMMLRDNNVKSGGVSQGEWACHQSPARPRTLFSSNRGSTDSGIRSDDQLEVQDISDSEASSSAVLPSFTRIQSRLNPVPESLNSPDIAPGPSPPRRDDPMISGPLSSLPPDLESRLAAARQRPGLVTTEAGASPRQRPSDIMAAAVTARTNGAKTPGGQHGGAVTRPTSAVKPVNVSSKVDSGLVRGGPGRTAVARGQRSHSPGARAQPQPRSHSPGAGARGHQRSHSAGPSRKNSLQHRQVASLKPTSASTAASSAAATPEMTRKHPGGNFNNLADDEASDTENELRMKNLEAVPKLRTRKSSQENGAGLTNRGRMSGGLRGQAGEQRPGTEMRTSSSISNLHSGASPRPRSTSLTRSQSQRLGGGGGRGQGRGQGPLASRSPAVQATVRPRSSTVASSSHRGSESGPGRSEAAAARSIQSGWRGHSSRTRDPEVREVKEELRSMRLEAHTKQLTKELRSARAALENERKLRKVQSDTIKVLWKEIQALQVEQELDREFGYHGGAGGGGGHQNHQGHHSGHSGYPDRRSEREKRRLTERKLGRLIGGAEARIYDDSDSSRGDEGLGRVEAGCDSGSSVASSEQERNVAALSNTCVMLQSQVDTLQRNLASVITFVSERSRHSSSSQDTPPLRGDRGHMMTASLDLEATRGRSVSSSTMTPASVLPSSMTMSLPPSLLLPNPVTFSKSCDSLAQTDIVAVRTPQIEQHKFLSLRKSHTDVDTSGASDSDATKLDSCRSSPRLRARSPRPASLAVGDPGSAVGHVATPKKLPPRGSDIPGMPERPLEPSPPGPKHVRSYASNIVDSLLGGMQTTRDSRGGDTCDEVTDISISYEVTESRHNSARNQSESNTSPNTGRPGSGASMRTVESDSLEDQHQQ